MLQKHDPKEDCWKNEPEESGQIKVCIQSEREMKQADESKRLYETTQLPNYRGPKTVSKEGQREEIKRIRGITDVPWFKSVHFLVLD